MEDAERWPTSLLPSLENFAEASDYSYIEAGELEEEDDLLPYSPSPNGYKEKMVGLGNDSSPLTLMEERPPRHLELKFGRLWYTTGA